MHKFNKQPYSTGKLSLAIPSWVGAMSTSQSEMRLCGWGAKGGMVHVWLAGDPIVTHGPCLERSLEIKSL